MAEEIRVCKDEVIRTKQGTRDLSETSYIFERNYSKVRIILTKQLILERTKHHDNTHPLIVPF